MFSRTSIVHSMLLNTIDFLSHHPLHSKDDASIMQWKNECKELWEIWTKTLPGPQKVYGTKLLDNLLDSKISLLTELKASKIESHTEEWTLEKRQANIQHLLERPQVEQRTHDWYMEASTLLTASQIGTLFGGPATRAKLVMDKASGNVDTSSRRTVVRTNELNAFTWGIRFEPVVKQIYSNLTGTNVVDLGRLKHATNTHLAASPDGLVVEGPVERLGRFVEFKAPVSRPILDIIPEDYLMQMQIQMEVGNVEECDYLEVRFHSGYGQRVMNPCTNPRFEGRIAIFGDIEETPTRYEYGPLNDTTWIPTAQDGEVLLEIVLWQTDQWYLKTVERSRIWFESIQQDLQDFWRDVELAKQGQFIVKPSTRKKKDVACMLIEDASEEKTVSA